MRTTIFFILVVLSVCIVNCSKKPAVAQPPFDTNTAEGLYQEGQYYLSQKMYEYAQRSFTTLIEEFPEHELVDDALFMLGEILSNPKNKNRDLEEALDYYQTIIDDYPESPYVKKAEKKVEAIEKKLEESD
ncbi:MAG: tetratricopeptide repeat protein [candidate division WOR-3 bacterium]